MGNIYTKPKIKVLEIKEDLMNDASIGAGDPYKQPQPVEAESKSNPLPFSSDDKPESSIWDDK